MGSRRRADTAEGSGRMISSARDAPGQRVPIDGHWFTADRDGRLVNDDPDGPTVEDLAAPPPWFEGGRGR